MPRKGYAVISITYKETDPDFLALKERAQFLPSKSVHTLARIIIAEKVRKEQKRRFRYFLKRIFARLAT